MRHLEFSYGVIPVRLEGESSQVFLVQHLDGYWSFPKGHREEAEPAKETAKRELFEETGLIVDRFVDHAPLMEEYTFSREGMKIDKEVAYYLAEVSGSPKLQSSEILEGNWFALSDVEGQLTYPATKKTWKVALDLLT